MVPCQLRLTWAADCCTLYGLTGHDQRTTNLGGAASWWWDISGIHQPALAARAVAEEG